MSQDNINHPQHYTSHPSGVECIDIIEHYPFNIGNAIKYLWRAGRKGDAIEDLEKAGILTKHSGNERYRSYIYKDYVREFGINVYANFETT